MRRGRIIALTVTVSLPLVVVAVAVAQPTASFVFVPASPASAELVTFTSTSTFSGRAIADYAWDLDGDSVFGEPGEPAGAGATTAARSFPGPGDYTVRLRVTDGAGVSDIASRVVTVGDASPPPPPPPPPATASPVPPPPEADGDRDGVGDVRDRCSGTPPATKPLRRGCSLTDLMVSPAGLLEDVADSLGEARAGVREMQVLRRRGRGSLNTLARSFGTLGNAARKLDTSPCEAARGARLALRKAGRGASAMAKLVAAEQGGASRREAGLVLRRPALASDSGRLDLVYHSLAQRRELVREVLVEMRGLGGLMQRACKASERPRSVRARVVSIAPGGSYAKVVGGRTLVLAGAKETRGLAPGVTVRARGIPVKGGPFVVTSALAEGVKTALVPQCSFTTWIAPVQDFSQANAKILYYDERGYREGFSYSLERGMGIGAVRGSGCTEKDDYRLSVRLAYRDTNGAKQDRLIGLLGGFLGGEAPARIPIDVDSKKVAVLRFEVAGQDCEQKGDIPLCTDVVVVSKGAATAKIERGGGWGRAVYNRNFFSVEDGSKSDFDIATLADVDAPALPGATIFGVGYTPTATGSSYPQPSFVVEGEQFAVHDDVPSAADPGGLRWAYVNGFRNGYPYHYTAKLPNIYTDVVDYCPQFGGGPSVHRLPWKDATLEQVVQGNLTPETQNNITHQGAQKYAFDFKMPALTDGYATRGGVVDYVEESLTKNSNPKAVKLAKDLPQVLNYPALPGNELRIKHDDGSYSRYVHMIKDGIIPKKGDRVERGDKVITVGKTGNATTAHLHWEWRDTPDGPSVLTRFEVGVIAPTNKQQCFIPGKGIWFSTNAKPSG